jgi:MFS transporter, ACS family, D-galactonate transporter
MIGSRRYAVYAGLFLLTFVSYVDRVNLSVAAGPIAAAFGLSPIELGYVFSAFLWTYVLLLIPMGIAADRFGGRTLTAAALAIWSLAAVCTGLAASLPALYAARLALGAGEAANYPAGGHIACAWAPRDERGFATACLNSGSYAGLCLGAPLVGWLVTVFGWRESFWIAGGVGLALAVVWMALYRRPEDARWLPEAERAHILANRGVQAPRSGGSPGRQVAALLRSPSMWALAVTQGCTVYTSYLFMTWLPNFLAMSRGLDVMKSGLFTAIPYGIAALTGMVTGALSDRLLRRPGATPADRRKLIAALLLASSVILATPLVQPVWLILVLLGLSLSCVGTVAGLNIALTADLVEDAGANGAAVSLLIVGGNTFGLAAPIVTGYVVAATGGFTGAFLIAGALLLAGALIVLFGARRPIRVPAQRVAAVAAALQSPSR